MDKIRELVEALHQKTAQQLIVSTRLATCKSVDWENKTMVATGLSDDLDYFDVLLGLGSIHVKPKVGSLCLVGIIENKEAEAFLIDAEEADEISLKAVKTTFNDGENGGLIKVEAIREQLNKTNALLEAIVGVINQSIVPEPGNNAPSALQTLLQGAIIGKELGNYSNITNDKVQH